MSMTCPACHKEITMEEAAFCPFCGAAMQPETEELSDEERAFLQKIQAEEHPVKKHLAIEAALKLFPDSLPIHEEALLLGRLYQRDGKHLDYSLIKCHLLHMYLTPEAFTEEQKTAKRTELFHDPELEICLRLSGDRSGFLQSYLRKLSKQFTNLFLCGSAYYTRSIFGFRLDRKLERALAEPAAGIIRQILKDEQLSQEEQTLLAKAFLLGFTDEVGDDSFVKQKLESENIIL